MCQGLYAWVFVLAFVLCGFLSEAARTQGWLLKTKWPERYRNARRAYYGLAWLLFLLPLVWAAWIRFGQGIELPVAIGVPLVPLVLGAAFGWTFLLPSRVPFMHEP